MNTNVTAPWVRRIAQYIIPGLLLAALAVMPPAERARAGTPSPLLTSSAAAPLMGTSYANYATAGQDVAPLAYAAGSRWDRVDFNWQVLQPSQTTVNWTPYDDLVTRQSAYGLDVIGILLWTPSWAADTSRCSLVAQESILPAQLLGRPSLLESSEATDETSKCPPRGLYLPWDDPGNVWGAFVYETVSHYSALGVSVWEIWNEPDMYTWFWRGSVNDYARLLTVGYQAAKAADPEAVVLFAGLAYWANPSYYVAVLDALTTVSGCTVPNYCFDAMSLHLYSNVYQIGPVAAEIQANVVARVGAHPIWLTETGAPLWDESPSGPLADRLNLVTAFEAGSYVIQAFAESRAVGIERFIFFRTHDADMSQYFGLIRSDDLTLRPAYWAFKAAATYLYGENQITGPFTSSGVRRVTFWGTPRGRIDVLWNTTSSAISYGHPAYLPEATLVTQEGLASSVPASEGRFTISLAPATANTGVDGAILVGGPPVLLIQNDTTSPTSALRPLPDPHYGAAVGLRWDVSDPGGTGYWYAEVERANASDGPWNLVAGLGQTRGTTAYTDTVPLAGRWYYRTRVRDNAGNWEDWPASAETQTTVWVTRTVTLSVTTFLDVNANGNWDADETAPTTPVIVWRDGAGDTVAFTTTSSWQITRTVTEGQHSVSVRVPDYIATPQAFQVAAGPDPTTFALQLGLRPVIGRSYLPLVGRQY